MSITDKLTGKAKQVMGDLTGDSKTRRQGQEEERKGEKKEELGRAQERADHKADEVADLERKTT
ncbi:MAG: CsbD family protein [Thermoleophilaceae bacterium]